MRMMRVFSCALNRSALDWIHEAAATEPPPKEMKMKTSILDLRISAGQTGRIALRALADRALAADPEAIAECERICAAQDRETAAGAVATARVLDPDPSHRPRPQPRPTAHCGLVPSGGLPDPRFM